jgi:two-component system, response regulator PdtaR
MSRSVAEKPAVILIVEDELLVRLVANDILEEAGYHTIEARDGQEALAILEIQSDVRLLFTDAMMPKVDGLTLAKIVAERWPDIRIIVSSALPPRPGALPKTARFLPKPYERGTVLQAVQEMLGIEAPARAESGPVLPTSVVTKRPGLPSGPGGLAQPLAEPDE